MSYQEKVQLIQAFLRWMQEEHQGVLWTPDPRSVVQMSADIVHPNERARQFCDPPNQ